MRDTQKLLDKLEYRERGIGLNGVRAIAQDCVT
jgi:hypothetical protein